ncbi:MAG: 2-hydroxychromene-2-carboxylate isomerase [Pseudomonadota bacterium]
MAKIDYYFATLSPYTYLAGTRFEEIAAKHDVEIAYKPLDVIALFGRTGGTPPKDRHPNRQEYRAQDLRRQAKKAGLDLNVQPAFFPTNPAPSSYAVINAAQEGGGDMGQLIQALGRACWAEDKNIAEDDVIRDCLARAGFDPDLTGRNLLGASETYSRNLEEAITRGAFGAPFYITDMDQRFWGQDRLEDLDAHLAGTL